AGVSRSSRATSLRYTKGGQMTHSTSARLREASTASTSGTFCAREPCIFQLAATNLRRMVAYPRQWSGRARKGYALGRGDAAHDARQLIRAAAYLTGIAALDHHPDHGLGPRGPQHDASLARQVLLHASHGLTDLRYARRIEATRDLHVQQRLRQLFHAGDQLGQRATGAFHDGQHPQRRDQAVPGGGAIQAQNMPGSLAAERAADFHQPREYVTVP